MVVDLSGRPGLEFHVAFARAMIGEFDVDLAHEFFQGFVNHALVTLHVDNLRGQNAHHQAETVFKAFARALRMASRRTRARPASCRRPRARSRGNQVSAISWQGSDDSERADRRPDLLPFAIDLIPDLR